MKPDDSECPLFPRSNHRETHSRAPMKRSCRVSVNDTGHNCAMCVRGCLVRQALINRIVPCERINPPAMLMEMKLIKTRDVSVQIHREGRRGTRNRRNQFCTPLTDDISRLATPQRYPRDRYSNWSTIPRRLATQ